MALPLDELLKLDPQEMLKHNEKPSAEHLRTKQQTFFEDVHVGMELPKYIYGPMTATHLFRWSAAIENWHRIHYDLDFAVNHDRLPNVLVQGSWKQSVIPSYLKDFCLPNGWFWKASFQHRYMLVPGDILIVWARVTDKQERDGLGVVELELGMRNQDGAESMPGTATIVLPLRNGRPVPYPFVPPSQG